MSALQCPDCSVPLLLPFRAGRDGYTLKVECRAYRRKYLKSLDAAYRSSGKAWTFLESGRPIRLPAVAQQPLFDLTGLGR